MKTISITLKDGEKVGVNIFSLGRGLFYCHWATCKGTVQFKDGDGKPEHWAGAVIDLEQDKVVGRAVNWLVIDKVHRLLKVMPAAFLDRNAGKKDTMLKLSDNLADLDWELAQDMLEAGLIQQRDWRKV